MTSDQLEAACHYLGHIFPSLRPKRPLRVWSYGRSLPVDGFGGYNLEVYQSWKQTFSKVPGVPLAQEVAYRDPRLTPTTRLHLSPSELVRDDMHNLVILQRGCKRLQPNEVRLLRLQRLRSGRLQCRLQTLSNTSWVWSKYTAISYTWLQSKYLYEKEESSSERDIFATYWPLESYDSDWLSQSTSKSPSTVRIYNEDSTTYCKLPPDSQLSIMLNDIYEVLLRGKFCFAQS